VQSVPEQLQCDYLEAYLALYRSDVEGARKIAEAHADEPVVRWRNLFTQLLTQLDELSGGAASAAEKESRDQTQGALAATEPALEMQVEAGNIRLDYRNLKGCTLNFYPMDIELLFSHSPFLQEGAAQFSFIRPVRSQSVELPAGKEMVTIEIPEEYRRRNVMVEALAAGAPCVWSRFSLSAAAAAAPDDSSSWVSSWVKRFRQRTTGSSVWALAIRRAPSTSLR